ncbi:MAG: spermidine/putrescine ABC transporter substrate-binding protein [Desulfovibrionaceae bacterium]|nr:spermidine/putrescine ABC transporter substrate-binding protein [Desulfovibrionaceae bacterium]
MKQIRIPIVILSLIFVFALASVSFAAQKAKRQVVVYNWSEYIPQDVLDDFTKETGIKVVYSTFESNEAMYAKVKLLRGKSYDVVVPSSYFVEMMRRDKLLQELDHAKLPNLVNLDPKLMDQEHDPGNKFSIPYMWGATGLAYNTKHVPEGSLTRWSQLLQPEFKGKIILTDDLRDAFGLALRAKGHSANTKDPAQIKEAFEFLVQLKDSVRVFDVTAIKQALISEEVWLGPIWNGDYLVAQEENDKLAYAFPQEGALLWVDSFTIPAGAANVDNAYTFINYMLRPEVALRCMEEYKYSSPNLKAIEMLPEELRNNRILVPGPEELKNAEFITYIGEALSIYEKYWEELKAVQ